MAMPLQIERIPLRGMLWPPFDRLRRACRTAATAPDDRVDPSMQIRQPAVSSTPETDLRVESAPASESTRQLRACFACVRKRSAGRSRVMPFVSFVEFEMTPKRGVRHSYKQSCGQSCAPTRIEALGLSRSQKAENKGISPRCGSTQMSCLLKSDHLHGLGKRPSEARISARAARSRK